MCTTEMPNKRMGGDTRSFTEATLQQTHWRNDEEEPTASKTDGTCGKVAVLRFPARRW